MLRRPAEAQGCWPRERLPFATKDGEVFKNRKGKMGDFSQRVMPGGGGEGAGLVARWLAVMMRSGRRAPVHRHSHRGHLGRAVRTWA